MFKISAPSPPTAVVGKPLLATTRDLHQRTQLDKPDKSSGDVQVAWSNRYSARSEKPFSTLTSPARVDPSVHRCAHSKFQMMFSDIHVYISILKLFCVLIKHYCLVMYE